jgi:hypothetical protein
LRLPVLRKWLSERLTTGTAQTTGVYRAPWRPIDPALANAVVAAFG